MSHQILLFVIWTDVHEEFCQSRQNLIGLANTTDVFRQLCSRLFTMFATTTKTYIYTNVVDSAVEHGNANLGKEDNQLLYVIMNINEFSVLSNSTCNILLKI